MQIHVNIEFELFDKKCCLMSLGFGKIVKGMTVGGMING